ncbi:sugar transferase [Sphingobium aromaticiconvertens]|uniref:sugar transferase n=1 Tax=Sphingobium aromaticiconvertens TaxID=365341 RepID=UPI00301607A2
MSRIDLAMEPNTSLLRQSRLVSRNVFLGLSAALCLADIIALLIGFLVGSTIAPITGTPTEVAAPLLAGILVFGVLAFHNQAYDARCLTSAPCSCRSAALAFASSTLICFLIIFALKATDSLSLAAIFVGLLCSGWIMLLQRLFIARNVARHLSDRLFAELMIVDNCAAPENAAGMRLVNAQAIGLRADLDDPSMLHQLGSLLQGFDRVIVVCPPDGQVAWSQMLKGSNILGEIVVPEMDGIAPLSVANWRGTPTLVVARDPLNFASRISKRLLDITITIPVLGFLMPLMVVIAIAIKLDSPGPILFRQQRIGRGNRLFRIMKFRSMRFDQADDTGQLSARRDDNRVTRVGRFIRSTSIDELPQLINVLLGEMSLVGPRPHALGSTAEDMLFWKVDRQYWHRHALKPGITGLAQIRGFRGATETKRDILNRIAADLEYMNQWSLTGDIAILLRTINVIYHKKAF